MKHQEEENKARQLAEVAEKERRTTAAWLYLCPDGLYEDAKKCLSENELKEFRAATGAAVNIYLQRGEGYSDDLKTSDYRAYLRIIHKRKEEERQRIAANVVAREYSERLNKEIVRVKGLQRYGVVDGSSRRAPMRPAEG